MRGRPVIQRIIGEGFLRFDYRNVDISLEDLSRLPNTPVILAMNHTDTFNYWPLQWMLHRKLSRYTATWVKGKNYENPFVRTFIMSTNNIPLASRGYVISRDFLSLLKRQPTDDEYRALRDAVDKDSAPTPGRVPSQVLEQPRDMLGRFFHPSREPYHRALRAVHREMMDAVVSLSRGAMDSGLDLLVFPQGTRSVRLSRGHTGVIRAALALGATIVPVGCNGSDQVYAGNTVFSGHGKIVYRVGEPFVPSAHVDPEKLRDFVPFADTPTVGPAVLQSLVDEVMGRINGLLDAPYRFSESGESDGRRGVRRFL